MNPAEKHIDLLVQRFFDVFDNRLERRPDFNQFQACFADGATISKQSADGVTVWSLAEFWQPRAELLLNGSLTEFHEWETEDKTFVHQGIAMRRCCYEKDGLLDGSPYQGTGLKFFHFALTPAGWLITSVLWQDEQ